MNRKTINIAVFAFLIVLTIIASVHSLSFVEQVKIGDGDTVSDATEIRKSGGLQCTWKYSSDTENITIKWYNNTVIYDTIVFQSPNLENHTNILSGSLTEEDIWNCTVTLTNTSGQTITDSKVIEIIYDPAIYIDTGSGYERMNQTFELYEDQDYTFIWNTTSTYIESTFAIGAPNKFCTDNSQSTYGEATCSPTSEYLGTNLNTSNNEIIKFQYDYSSGTQKNTINFTIIPVNDEPVFTVSDYTMNESDNWNPTITATDEEGNFPINFTVELPNFCSYTNTSNALTLDCTPTALDIGNHTINITAIDNPPYNETYPLTPQNSTPKSFVLEVLEINHIPNITYVSNTNSSQNKAHSIYMNATDQYDNSTMTFSITSTCNLTNPWTGVITTNTVTFNESGNSRFNTYANATWTGVLTNNHIICRNATVTVTDNFGSTDTQNVLLNISNENDAPEIHNYSHNPGDLLNNKYINNLTAFLEAPFTYQINATDIDFDVEYDSTIDDFNESLTYTSNDSTWLNRFLDSNTGLIDIPAENMSSSVGNYTYLINVSDNGLQSLSDTVIMTLEIKNNTAPQFSQTLNKTCYEYDSLNWATSCTYNISEIASDAEGQTITYSDNSGTFNVSSTGLLQFNANQDMVNEHSFNVTITDTKGANTTATMYLYIYNTNNNPNITSIPVRSPPTGLYYQRTDNNIIPIIVNDLDEEFNETNSSHPRYDYETLTFTWSSSYSLDGYIVISNSTRNMTINTSVGIGNFSVNITVTDFYNKTGNYTYNFTIHNITAPPEITFIYPYGSNGVTTFGWLNVTDAAAITYINITENSTIFFNQTVSDENPENLTYKWFYDDVELNATTIFNHNSTAILIGNSYSTNFTFGFFEASYLEVGDHNLTFVVIDGFDQTLNDTFTWKINVTDKNRPIVLDQPIANITIEGSRNKDNKDLWIAGNDSGFYDPDYDYNGDGVIAFAESNFSITYTIENSTCGGYATINVSDTYTTLFDQTTNATWISGHGIVGDAVENGTCNLIFVATDGQYSARSNIVYITSEVRDEQTTIIVTTTSGGGTRTVTTTIPYPEEVEVPIPITIIMPDMVTVYENNSIDIPLIITNTWNKSVFGVYLDYEINESADYIVNFGRRYFYEIKPGEEMKTTMTITNYRVGGIYEVLVIANVTNPAYVDTAKIYLNSIEQTSTGERVKTLIRFARDLLQKHKECQEIAEVLNEATKAQEQGQLETALGLANSAINGCKYIISQEQKRIESPRRFRSIYIPLNKENLKYILYIAVPVLLLGGGYMFYRKRKLALQEAKEEESSKSSGNET